MSQLSSIMKKGKPDSEVPEMARRMRYIRRAVEGDDHGAKSRFVNKIGLSLSQWSNLEAGSNVTPDVAGKLVTKIAGLDYNYIYGGSMDNLPVRLARQLQDQYPEKEKTA